MLLANLRLKLAIGFVGLLLIGGLVTWAYISGSSSRISQLEREQIANNLQIEAQEAVLEQQQRDMENLRRISENINRGFSRAANNLNNLRRRLEQQNLREQAQTDVPAVEAVINQDTVFTNRCNEIVTGAPVTEADEQNTVCPELIAQRRSS